MVTIEVSVSDLRAAYMPGRAKIGEVAPNGPTYRGTPIARMVFGRYDRVEYWNGSAPFATFQGRAAVDD